MESKKINQLATEMSPAATDLTIIGDPITGVSKKITLEQIASLFAGSVSFYANLAAFPVTGTIDTIYCAKDTNKLYLWSGSAYVQTFPSQALLDTYQLRSEKGASNGYASLDSAGKVPVSQLPSSIMEYKGMWSAATNTPTLANGTGDTGDVYICNAAGSVNFGAGAITFAVGDYVIYSGSIWQRSSGAVGTVTSVGLSTNGNSVTIGSSPVTTSGTISANFVGDATQYINGAGNLTTFPTLITSIGLSMPSAFSVANSPLTANGTIAVTGAGTTAQYIRGDGSLATFPTIASEAQRLITEVYNSTGATLTKGTVVYINGGQGNLPTVTKAIATGDATSAQTYGIVQTDITNMNNGYVVVVGSLMDLDTQAYAAGTQLYLSSTTAGAWTSVKQYAPAHLVYVGIVVRSHPTQGVVEVRIQNGFEMDELHNVSAQSPLNNQGLFYNTSTSLWENKSIATALGYTPADDSLVVHLTGNETIGGTKTFSDATKNNGGIFLQNASSSSLAGYMNLGGLTNGVKFTSGGGISNTFTLPSATGYTFTFPNATGTIALTSDISYPVTSVFGRTGAVVATSGDYTTAQVTESGNLYFTDSRARLALSAGTGISYNNTTGVITNSAPDQTVSLTAGAGISVSGSYPSFTIASTITQYTDALARAALSFVAGSGAYNSTTGVITIPTNNNQITNGAGYITSSALSGYLPLTGGTLTGALNINLSSGTALNVAGNAIFRGDTGVGTPRQLIITSGGSTPVYLEAKGYGANYQTDFGIKTFNNVGTAFEVFYADSSGRVGINQVSPSYQLDVNGTGRFSDNVLINNSASLSKLSIKGSGSTTGLDLYVFGANATLSNQDNGSLAFETNGTTRLTISSTGLATFSNSIVLSATGYVGFGGGTNYIEGDNTNNILRFGTNNVTRLTIASTGAATFTGNVTAPNLYAGSGTGAPSVQVFGGASSNSIGGSAYITLQDVTNTRFWGLQADASQKLNFWHFNGGWSSVANISSTGAATFSSSVQANGNLLMYGNDITFYGSAPRIVSAGYSYPIKIDGSTILLNSASGGNVGIGTVSPNAKLEITNGRVLLNNGYSYQFYNTAGTAVDTLQMFTDGNVYLDAKDSTGGNLIFRTTNSVTERMRITSGGVVGIGTATPSGTRFNVHGDNNTATTLFSSASAVLQIYPYFYTYGGPIIQALNSAQSAYVPLRFEASQYQLTNGNVLINTTTNTNHKLTVHNATDAGQIRVTGGAPTIYFTDTLTDPANYVGLLGMATGANNFITGTAAGDFVLLNQTNSKKLYVVNYSGGVYLSSGATSWTANSDIRLKKINSHIENAVEKLSTLQTINFSYKDDKTNKQNLGLIAQEVEKIFPELIDKNGDGMLGVRYTELVPVLIKAIQEQQKEINELKLKIK